MVKNAITVFARVKPETSRKGLVSYKIHRRPKKHSNEDFLVLTAPQKFAEYIDNRPESWNFSFSRIFKHDVPQDDVFDSVARPVVNRVFDGYNATIFAYGQTGSGKTYTITGEPGVHSERGILPRTLQYIFDIVRKNPENLYSVEVAYLEIYNENGYDLLLERKQREAAGRLEDLPRVTIQEDETGTMHLKNLSFRVVESEKEALQFLVDGDMYRAISETPMNPRSSRSHCIFTIVVSVKKIGEDRYSRAKMHLVDLAGSERVYKCSIQGTILTEAKHINLSLHFLEQVIVSLGQDNVSHVPYRNSLLTSILRDSLGGNCLTTMLATLSVSAFNLEETISTCRFAQRVAIVKNDVNLTFELDTKSENALLRMENERLRKQIEELREQTSESSTWVSSTRSLEYYKNLVIQRDQEISRLIDILRKERGRGKSIAEAIVEAPLGDLSEAARNQRATQEDGERISPRSVYQRSPTILKKRRHGNSLQGKAKMSPRRDGSCCPTTGREIQTSKWSARSAAPEVPNLILKEEALDGVDVGGTRDSRADSNAGRRNDTDTDGRETAMSARRRRQDTQTLSIEDSRIKDHGKSTKLPVDQTERTDSNIAYRSDTEKERRKPAVLETNWQQDTQTLSIEDSRIKDPDKSTKLPVDQTERTDSNIAYRNDTGNLRRKPAESETNWRQDTQALNIEDSPIKDHGRSTKLPVDQTERAGSTIAYRSDTEKERRKPAVSETNWRQNTQTLNIEDSRIKDHGKSTKLPVDQTERTGSNIAYRSDTEKERRKPAVLETNWRQNTQTLNIEDSRIKDHGKSTKLPVDQTYRTDSDIPYRNDTGNLRREPVMSKRIRCQDTQTLNIEDLRINHNQKSKKLPDAEIDANTAYHIDSKTGRSETIASGRHRQQNTQILNIEEINLDDNEESNKHPVAEANSTIAYHNSSKTGRKETVVSESPKQNTQTLNIEKLTTNQTNESKKHPNPESNSTTAYHSTTKTGRKETVVSESPRQQNTQKLHIDALTTNQSKESTKHPNPQSNSTTAYHNSTKTVVLETLTQQTTQTLNIKEPALNEVESKIKEAFDLPAAMLEASRPNVNASRNRDGSNAAQDTQTPRRSCLISANDVDVTKSSVVPRRDKIADEKSPSEKSPLLGFPRNVMKMIRTPRNRHPEDNDVTSKSGTPRSGFKAPSILRSMMCRDKSSPGDSQNPIADKKPNESSGTHGDPKISNDFKKSLPLTGDPEIDEEIIAFYKAKRSGGVY